LRLLVMLVIWLLGAEPLQAAPLGGPLGLDHRTLPLWMLDTACPWGRGDGAMPAPRAVRWLG